MTEKYDVIVIGSGPGGYIAAIRCAQLGLKTACVEKGELGGTCLNVGCMPSKALLHSSELFFSLTHEMPLHGIDVSGSFNFDKMMDRKETIVTGFNQGIGVLFKKNKIDHLQGHGKIASSTSVTVEGTEYGATTIIIATGSEPISLPFLPIDEKLVLSSTGALSLKTVPKKMVVIGAGVIGVELGSVYSRLGSEVTFIEFLPKICPTLDETISKKFQQILEGQGLTFHLSSKVEKGEIQDNQVVLTYDGDKTIVADKVLESIGRRPFTQELGLESVGLTTDEKGFIPINKRFQTDVSSIYAIGDVVDGPMLAHKAMEEGMAVAEVLAGLSPMLDYIAIPNVVYTNPEVATVGLTEAEAQSMGLAVKTGTFPFATNSRAKATGQTDGLVKVVSDGTTGKLLGVHILGAHASEMIGEAVIALTSKLKTEELASRFHAHPTLTEAIKEAALVALGRAIHR